MTLKAILFDKDGTLIDFDKTWGPAAYEVMRALSRGDEAKFAELVRVCEYRLEERRFEPTSPLVAGSTAGYGPLWAQALGCQPGIELYAEMNDLFRIWGLRSLTPIGVPSEVLASLAARGLKLGIATNDSERSARIQSDALGLSEHCDFIVGYDSGHGAKPHPGMITAFAAHCGCEPREVALVGDSLHDMEAARLAGAFRIAVLSGPLQLAARPDIEPHADAVIASIADLEALVVAMGRQNGIAEGRRPRADLAPAV